MKNFYEMMMILENVKNARSNERKSINESTVVFGEDEDDPYSGEFYLDIEHDESSSSWEWETNGSFYVKNRLQDGSEPAISKPKFYVAGKTMDQWGKPDKYTGTEFMNPGKRLENLPASIKAHAIAWVEKQVEKYVDNYEPHDPSDYDHDGPSGYDDGGSYWDNYWSVGPGRDPD